MKKRIAAALAALPLVIGTGLAAAPANAATPHGRGNPAYTVTVWHHRNSMYGAWYTTFHPITSFNLSYRWNYHRATR